MKPSLLSWFGALALACATPPATPSAHPAPPAKAKPPAVADSWRSKVPTPGKPAELVYPTAESTTLPNGLSVLFVKRPARVTSLSVVIRHGASSVPPGKSGLAALTARMLTEGTKKRSASLLAEAAESLGSSLGHDAGRDYSTLGIDTLTADFERGLELLAEVVQQPAFAPRELTRVRTEWLDGLTAERQSPDRLASLAGLRVLLGDATGAPVGGSVPDVKKLTRQDLVAFHAAHYVPSASALVVVGDQDFEHLKSVAMKFFGAWQGKPPPAAAAPELPAAPQQTRVLIVNRPGAVQSAVFVAQPFPKRSEPGHEARRLLSSLLGGLFTSRINQNLREKNAYTYGARSDAIATRDWGALVVSTRVEAGVTAPALVELTRELAKARDPKLGAPITDDEVSRARADLVSSLGAHLVEVDRVASDLAVAFAEGLGPDYYAGFGRLLAARTTAEVATEARRLDETRLVVVIVGDRAEIGPALEKAGFSLSEAKPELTE
ncbi:MAG: insulinase family protein [Myxococcales bacterium]|nr:insulinase family protein [Myxococcales bacterium]